MKPHFTGLPIVALLLVGTVLPGFAEDAASPNAPAAPAAAQTEAPPPSVARPSIAPKTAQPAPPPVADDPAPRRHRHYRRYGYYRTAYWEPFPIYWPHFYRHRIHWNRIPWMFRF